MSKLNTRKILFAIFVIVLISLSCGPPRFTPKGVDIDDDELQALNDNVAGVYETASLVELSDSEIDRLCEPPAYWLSNRTETLEFKDNKLIISDGEEKRTYVYQDFGTQDFCRELDDGKIECISHPDKNGYSLTLYEGKNDLRICFFGSQTITRVDQPPTSEIQWGGTDDESLQAEEQSQAEDPADEPSDLQESSDFDFLACIPKPEEYTLELVDLTNSSSEVKRRCNADGVITNNSDQEIMFSAYRVHNYGGWDYEKWDGPGYQTVKPGETVEYAEFYRCTGGNCGDGDWFYFKYISIMYYTPECLQYTFEHNEKPPESIIEIANPCDW